MLSLVVLAHSRAWWRFDGAHFWTLPGAGGWLFLGMNVMKPMPTWPGLCAFTPLSPLRHTMKMGQKC